MSKADFRDAHEEAQVAIKRVKKRLEPRASEGQTGLINRVRKEVKAFKKDQKRQKRRK